MAWDQPPLSAAQDGHWLSDPLLSGVVLLLVGLTRAPKRKHGRNRLGSLDKGPEMGHGASAFLGIHIHMEIFFLFSSLSEKTKLLRHLVIHPRSPNLPLVKLR